MMCLMENPLVSVIIPTYNRKGIVMDTINSVYAQDYQNTEVIVIDDGSTDGTSDFLQSLDYPIRLYSQSNAGVSSARNLGIKYAAGEYLVFLDSDDIWLRSFVSSMVQFFRDNQNFNVAYSDQFVMQNQVIQDITRVEREGRKDKIRFPGIVEVVPFHPSVVMMEKTLCNEIGYFDESLLVFQDVEYWNRISLKHSFGFVDKPLCIKKESGSYSHLSKFRDHAFMIEESTRYLNLYEKYAFDDDQKLAVQLSREMLLRYTVS